MTRYDHIIYRHIIKVAPTQMQLLDRHFRLRQIFCTPGIVCPPCLLLVGYNRRYHVKGGIGGVRRGARGWAWLPASSRNINGTEKKRQAAAFAAAS